MSRATRARASVRTLGCGVPPAPSTGTQLCTTGVLSVATRAVQGPGEPRKRVLSLHSLPQRVRPAPAEEQGSWEWGTEGPQAAAGVSDG